MNNTSNRYDEFAAEYTKMVTKREEAGIEQEPDGVTGPLLNFIGDVSNLNVLDAGCGEGYLARILANRGARVVGADIAPALIKIAEEKDPKGQITYLHADLSQPLPHYQQHFDLVASHLVLNDVHDYQGFLRSLATSLKPGGRLVLSMNNPYSYIVRNHLSNYFDSGKAVSYRGMAEKGVKVHFYQRTLTEYLDAGFSAGLQLQRLVDLPTLQSILNKPTDKLLPNGYQFPYFMLLGFQKPR
jgi:SAM-dependent methyltransferase